MDIHQKYTNDSKEEVEGKKRRKRRNRKKRKVKEDVKAEGGEHRGREEEENKSDKEEASNDGRQENKKGGKREEQRAKVEDKEHEDQESEGEEGITTEEDTTMYEQANIVPEEEEEEEEEEEDEEKTEIGKKKKEKVFKVKQDTGNKITYLKGDATLPQAKGHKIIAHGRWGKGFVLAITIRFGNTPEKQYYSWHKGRANNDFKLGSVQFVNVNQHITIANILAQQGLAKRRKTGPPKVCVQYEALQEGLTKVQQKAEEMNASIHMPRIGVGLGGGKWDIVEAIIVGSITSPVFVYDY